MSANHPLTPRPSAVDRVPSCPGLRETSAIRAAVARTAPAAQVGPDPVTDDFVSSTAALASAFTSSVADCADSCNWWAASPTCSFIVSAICWACPPASAAAFSRVGWTSRAARRSGSVVGRRLPSSAPAPNAISPAAKGLPWVPLVMARGAAVAASPTAEAASLTRSVVDRCCRVGGAHDRVASPSERVAAPRLAGDRRFARGSPDRRWRRDHGRARRAGESRRSLSSSAVWPIRCPP